MRSWFINNRNIILYSGGLLLAIFIYLASKTFFQLLSKKLSRNKSKFLPLIILKEISSDVNLFGKIWSVLLAILSYALLIPGWYWQIPARTLSVSVIVFSGVVAIAALNIWAAKLNQKTELNTFLTPKSKAHRKTLISFAVATIKYIIYIIGIIGSLTALGIDLTGVLAFGAVATLVFGFACQQILQDIFAGGGIFFERYFIVGDVVELPGFENNPPERGRVERITWRSTFIQTETGMYAISNRKIDKIKILQKLN